MKVVRQTWKSLRLEQNTSGFLEISSCFLRSSSHSRSRSVSTIERSWMLCPSSLSFFHFIPVTEWHQRGYLWKLHISGSASPGERNHGSSVKDMEHLLRAPRTSGSEPEELKHPSSLSHYFSYLLSCHPSKIIT